MLNTLPFLPKNVRRHSKSIQSNTLPLCFSLKLTKKFWKNSKLMTWASSMTLSPKSLQTLRTISSRRGKFGTPKLRAFWVNRQSSSLSRAQPKTPNAVSLKPSSTCSNLKTSNSLTTTFSKTNIWDTGCVITADGRHTHKSIVRASWLVDSTFAKIWLLRESFCSFFPKTVLPRKLRKSLNVC